MIMKTFLGLILSLLSFGLYAQHEFAPIGAEWYYEKVDSYNPPKFGYTKLTSIKDSIIENKKVRVIEVLDAPNDTTQTIEGYEYICQSGDTVWYWKGNRFHILYNFAMQKGDSILLYSEMKNECGNNPYGWNKVDSTFSRIFNDTELKAYFLIPINNSQWEFSNYIFEIIGSIDYFIPQNSFCGIYDIINYGPLRCYSDPINGVLITSLPKVRCDSTYTYTGPIKPDALSQYKKTDTFSVSPNPVADEITIKHYKTDILNDNYEIKIINIRGIVVKSYKLALETIDVSDLTKGTYFLTISINEKIIDCERFVKI
jgi:hypothetical protein